MELPNGERLRVDVMNWNNATLRFTVFSREKGEGQVIVPLSAIMNTWPLIEAALTLRGIKP
jgi:hypothetical protein